MQKYRIAGVIFKANFIYALSARLMQKYQYFGKDEAEFTAEFNLEEIELASKDFPKMPLPYVENTLIFKKFCDFVLNNKNGLIFHSSAIAVEGKAYLFAAPSGTGKSTHTALWRELFGVKAVMINDDKPLIRLEDGEFYVYGTPWNGKHGLDTDCRVKIQAICHLQRGEDNEIEPIDAKEMLPVILGQTLRPTGVEQMDKLLALTEQLLGKVGKFRLKCNTDISAAKLSYSAMKGEN
ncbi:MAG: hypothetical protein IKZ38_04445 [Clostridia bacterium]|nr:hypothetical protein [Clostridia bacterium]